MGYIGAGTGQGGAVNGCLLATLRPGTLYLCRAETAACASAIFLILAVTRDRREGTGEQRHGGGKHPAVGKPLLIGGNGGSDAVGIY